MKPSSGRLVAAAQSEEADMPTTAASHTTRREAFEVALAGDFCTALKLLEGCEEATQQVYQALFSIALRTMCLLLKISASMAMINADRSFLDGYDATPYSLEMLSVLSPWEGILR